MKECMFDALSPVRQTIPEVQMSAQHPAAQAILLNRRGFVQLGAAGLGVLTAATSALACPFRPIYPAIPPMPPMEQGPPLIPVPAEVPVARLTFEVSSGVNPQYMLRMLQDYIAYNLTPDYAGQVVQARAVARVPTTFHQNYWSDYGFQGQIPPTRTRFGYYTGVNELARADAQAAIRMQRDLNYFEMRRVINGSEINTFGMPLLPNGDRRPPTPADMEAYTRVARQFYGINNPNEYALMYARQFTNGRNAFNTYMIARGPDPMRSPFKDLLIDNVPA